MAVKDIKTCIMKKYYKLTITSHDGRVWDNPLMLSESGLIAKAVRENRSVLVELKEMSLTRYNLTFVK